MFDANFLALIATCVAMTVLGTEAIKKLTGVKGTGVIVLSLVISAIVALNHAFGTEGFVLWKYGALTLATWVQANGWYIFKAQMAEKTGTKKL